MMPMREMTLRDRSFVVPTWARSSRYGLCTRDSFRLVNQLLEHPRMRVICIATDERTVHAWIAGHDDVLHFAYTAPELRRKGLARQLSLSLFGARGATVLTHEAPKAIAPRARMNPYLLADLFAEREAA